MALQTYDDLINAITVNNRMQKLYWFKALRQSGINLNSGFFTDGVPGLGTSPTVGLGNAAKCTVSTAGALGFTAPGGGRSLYLLSVNAYKGAFSGTYYLVDRLAHANLSIVQADGNFSPAIDGTDRLAAGEGGVIWCEVTTALSAAANVFTLGYTNQAGTSGRTTAQVTTVASTAIGKAPYAPYSFIPLQSGDTGVRTIDSWDLVSGAATGNMNICLGKIIASIPYQSLGTEKEFFNDIPSLPPIHSSACLNLLSTMENTSTTSELAEVRIIED